MVDAVLGTQVTLPTLTGEAKVKIPDGTQPDAVLRLSGEGLPFYGSERRGDLFIRVNVQVPELLSPQERALYRQLRELEAAEEKC